VCCESVGDSGENEICVVGDLRDGLVMFRGYSVTIPRIKEGIDLSVSQREL
jgi:predicted RNA-binding protein with TRAM domain